MINPNKFANQKIQELGQNLFQGEEFAQQIANKQLDQPVPPPGPYGDINPIMNKDSREARRQERKSIREANKGLRQARKERAKGVKEQGQENYSYDGYEKGRYNKKGDDIEYGKTPRYSKKNPPLNQNDPNKGRPYVVNKEKTGTSRDTLYLPKNAFVSKSGYVDDEEYERLATKASKDGTYNYEGGAFDWRKLEDKGKVKYKK